MPDFQGVIDLMFGDTVNIIATAAAVIVLFIILGKFAARLVFRLIIGLVLGVAASALLIWLGFSQQIAMLVGLVALVLGAVFGKIPG